MILIQFRSKQELIQNDNNNKCNPNPMFNIVQVCKSRSTSQQSNLLMKIDRKIEHSDWQPYNKQQLKLKVQRKVTTQQTVLFELVLIGWFKKNPIFETLLFGKAA